MEIQVIDSPRALPGKCYYCGGASKTKYLDTGIQIEFYGALYICDECMEYIGKVMGYITPDRANDFEQKNHRLIHENEELNFKLTALEQAINSLRAAGFDDSSGDTPNGIVVHSDLSVSENGQPSLSFPQESTGDLEQGEGEPSESPDDEGMAIVHAGEPASNPFDL